MISKIVKFVLYRSDRGSIKIYIFIVKLQGSSCMMDILFSRKKLFFFQIHEHERGVCEKI